jgi:hypothetical protein
MRQINALKIRNHLGEVLDLLQTEGCGGFDYSGAVSTTLSGLSDILQSLRRREAAG